MSLFYDFKHSEVVEKVTMKWPSDDYIIPAGTPMSRTGIANNGDAIGILASEARVQFDFPLSVAKHIGKKEPKGNKDFTFEIITGGFVNLTDAESAFGEKYTEEAKAAMSGISFVDESGEGMGGGASSWNDLKDKPFGEEVSLTEVVVLEAELTDGMAQLSLSVRLVDGETYTVNLDSGSYQAVCTEIEESGVGSRFLGNLSLLGIGDDTGETFVVGVANENGNTVVMDAGGGATISVIGATSVIHPIDRMFLPKHIVVADGEIYLNQEDNTYTLSEGLEFDWMAGCLVRMLGDLHYIQTTTDTYFCIHKIQGTYTRHFSGEYTQGAQVYTWVFYPDGTYTFVFKDIA